MRSRIVTINTAKEDAPYRHRLRLLGDGLRDLAPDLVLAQETVTIPDEGVDTAASLARALGFHLAAASARPKLRRVDGVVASGIGGLAILSRYPILDQDVLALPTDPRDGERIALFARLAAPAGELMVINVHLTYLRDALALRAAEVAAVFAHPWLAAASAPLATIFGGDLNTDLPDLPILLAAVPPVWRLSEAFADGGGQGSRVTMPAYWASTADRALDYLFAVTRREAGTDAPAAALRWSEARIVLATPDVTGVYPSDHRGMLATLTLTAPDAVGDPTAPLAFPAPLESEPGPD